MLETVANVIVNYAVMNIAKIVMLVFVQNVILRKDKTLKIIDPKTHKGCFTTKKTNNEIFFVPIEEPAILINNEAAKQIMKKILVGDALPLHDSIESRADCWARIMKEGN